MKEAWEGKTCLKCRGLTGLSTKRWKLKLDESKVTKGLVLDNLSDFTTNSCWVLFLSFLINIKISSNCRFSLLTVKEQKVGLKGSRSRSEGIQVMILLEKSSTFMLFRYNIFCEICMHVYVTMNTICFCEIQVSFVIFKSNAGWQFPLY